MKTIVPIILTMFFITSAGARILTVSNNPASPGQYTDVQLAINAGLAGDTIYVHGSSTVYPDFTITKRLVVIGAGYNSNNQFNLSTRVGNINLFRDAGLQNANGTTITGFLIGASLNCGGTLPITNITLFRNSIGYILYTYSTSSVLGSNWLIYNNIIAYVYGGSSGPLSPSSTNITIQNNLITNSISNFSTPSVLIDHNLFVAADKLSSVFYATITNNIFVMTAGTIFNSSVSGNVFNNNLSLLTTVGTVAPTNSFLGGPNTGSNNLVGIDPQFVNFTGYNSYSFGSDYHLKTTSPAHNAGSDGTDLGIYGGSYPFPSGGASGSGYETSPTPPIPQVTEVNIQNGLLTPGTPLNVNVKAKVNN